MPRLEFRGSEIVEVRTCSTCGAERPRYDPHECDDCLEASE